MSWVQQHWDARAALNFMLGGAGGGMMVSAVLADRPAIIALALALVAGGLGAVWLEIGKKLRALNVFFNPFTSWMTRESFAALLLFALGAVALWNSAFLPLAALAALAALAFVYCQGRILRAARGIPAWRAPQVTLLIVATALAEGAGLALFFTTAPLVVGWFGLALILRAFAWTRYRAAVAHPALDAPGKALVHLGTIGALVLALAGGWVPGSAPLAGLLALATGLWLKFALVTRASHNQGYALPRLPVRGAR